MSNDGPFRPGFPPRRDAPEPAVPVLRMKSDLSRTHLVTARISGKLTLRTGLLVRRMAVDTLPGRARAAGGIPAPPRPASCRSGCPGAGPASRPARARVPLPHPSELSAPPARRRLPPPPRPSEPARLRPPPTPPPRTVGSVLRRRVPAAVPATPPPAPAAEGTGLHPEFIFDCEHCRQRIDASGMALFEVVQCPACEGHNAVPGRLDHYLLREPLGEGGMGVVYRARDEHLHRDVALKIIRRDLLRDDTTAAQFVREARAAARLNHPHIVHVYAIGDLRGDPYIVMELLTRIRLDTLMADGKPLPELLLLYTAYDMARALDSARRAGVVHGDIKPANVLYNEHGQAKLIDFGLATFFQERRGEMWGTPLYMAPERVLQKGEDWRSDQFSLGITLWYAHTGRPPFDGRTPSEILRAIVNDPLPDLAAARPGVDLVSAEIIARMCAKDPAARYPDYDEPLRLLRQRILEHKRSLSAPIPYPAGLEVLETREVG